MERCGVIDGVAMPTSVSWAKRLQEYQPGFEHAEGAFAMPSDVVVAGVPRVGWVPVGGVPPALGSDYACGAGGVPTGLPVLTEIGCGAAPG